MLLDHFVSSITSPHSTDSLDGVLPPFFSISECGPYSLRQHIDLPGSQIGGELLLSLNELSVTPVSLASVESGFDKRQLKVTLNPAALKGRYELFCLENPRVTMDTGGLLCSGLMKPDTHLGENARHIEVSDDQATSCLFR